jgi:hypothetical protein
MGTQKHRRKELGKQEWEKADDDIHLSKLCVLTSPADWRLEPPVRLAASKVFEANTAGSNRSQNLHAATSVEQANTPHEKTWLCNLPHGVACFELTDSAVGGVIPDRHPRGNAVRCGNFYNCLEYRQSALGHPFFKAQPRPLFAFYNSDIMFRPFTIKFWSGAGAFRRQYRDSRGGDGQKQKELAPTGLLRCSRSTCRLACD